MYDAIIIGLGPAGMTAGIYCARKNMKTLIIGMSLGGQTTLSSRMENYPGVEPISGAELMQKFEKQTKGFGAETKYGKVSKVEKKGKEFKIILDNGETYDAKTVILAFGKTPRTLGFPGEKEFFGKGVSTCATCDGPLYKGKDVVVIGGGNSALDAVQYLSGIAKKVYIVHRRDEYRGDVAEIEKMRKLKNVEEVLSYIPKEVKGDKDVTGLVVESKKDGSTKELKVDGIFLEVGYIVDPGPVKDLVELNKFNEIVVDLNNNTSMPGIFAAGDCTITPYKQTIISAGDGAKAALEAYKYIHGGKLPALDWGGH